ncbi:MAG: sensor histidine kinase [Desulfotomaculaceae bacterium]|nr:sensor histidine kinase [Desulfotomaculaceae bacterium]
MFVTNDLDRIIKETLESIERSKIQLYNIEENSMEKLVGLNKELTELNYEVDKIIKQADKLAAEEKKARVRLMEVSKDFRKYTEKYIKDAYDTAYLLQLELVKTREKEKVLICRRNYLEVRMRRLEDTANKAVKLVSQMGVVLNFLSGGRKDLNTKTNELQKAQDMALSIIKAQEEERKRVAREIHDGPAQSMANIVMRAEFCLKLLDMSPKKVRNELISLQNIVRISLMDVRKIIFDLRPMVLDDLGLVPAIKRYLSNYKEQYGLQVEFTYSGQQARLENSVEVALFRIIQEIVSNIHKHACAKNSVIKIEMINNRVNIQVRDDGKGFDLDEVMANKEREGYGLLGIQERVQLLNGEINIVTAPGKGTSIIISVPLKCDVV